MKLHRIAAFLLSLALAVTPAWGQFVPGQVLGAAALNAALAAPTITGGSVNGAPIGQSSAKAVNGTTFGVVGANTGLVTITPQSNAGTYSFNLPTTAGTSGYLLTAPAGSSSPMIWTAPSALSVANAVAATSSVNMSGGTVGALPYQSNAGASTFLSLGTTGYVLQAGASAPAWVAQSGLSVGSATNGETVATTTNALFYPALFASSANGNQAFNLSTALTYNPSTGALAATSASLTTATITSLTAPSASFTTATISGLSGLVKANGASPATVASAGTDVVTPGLAQDTQGFRLTLTSGLAVTTSDVTSATTVFATPYKSNLIALYTGSAWVLRASAEFSAALGTLSSGQAYDVFAYDNSGTPTLELLAWTNSGARATALAYQDGVLVKSGATTRRYLGSFLTTSTTTTEDSTANRYFYNYYHRVPRSMRKLIAAASYNYTTATWRQANADTANQINFFVGVVEDPIDAIMHSTGSNTGLTATFAQSIGLNVTNTSSGSSTGGASAVASAFCTLGSALRALPSLGKNFAAIVEYSQASGTTTFYGSNTPLQSGIYGSIPQ